jgi:hypothetical protein
MDKGGYCLQNIGNKRFIAKILHLKEKGAENAVSAVAIFQLIRCYFPVDLSLAD